MAERHPVNPNHYERSTDQSHASRYFLARGFIRPTDTVIDAACGTGYGSAILAEVAKKVYAFDNQKVFDMEQWKKRNNKFELSDIEHKISYPKCDVFVCLETIEHLHDPEYLIKKAMQFTKRVFIVSSPNKPTTETNPHHVSNVMEEVLDGYMEKYEDWFKYQTFYHDVYYISIYINTNEEIYKTR